ncbi:hypothetical protein ACLKA7_012254 [Drosophila subpalustris]
MQVATATVRCPERWTAAGRTQIPHMRRVHVSVRVAETFVFIVAECPEETSKCCLDFAVLLVGGWALWWVVKRHVLEIVKEPGYA